ncbi:MAG: hypothetical protein LC131_19165 [Anaerolineae bacterium]|jgi:hypothetical protein|nr:hypothetical protein [Planctomycetota bacterium]MCZ2115927.1 hypothetical protein [Anaerolineae bacterium]
MKSLAAAVCFFGASSSACMRGRAWLYVLVIICYVIGKLGQLAALAPMLSTLSLMAIIISLPAVGSVTRVLTALFLGGGTFMLYWKNVPWSQYLGAFGEMAYLLALIAVVPILSTPVKLGGYGGAIQTTLRGRIASVWGLNCLATTLAFVCGSFMSLAAVPIMISSLGPVVGSYRLRNPVRFMAVAAAYGYVLPILWTPVSGVVGVVLHSLHVDWLSLFPILFVLSVAALCSNWAIFYLLEPWGKEQAAPITAEPTQRDTVSPVSRLLQMLLAIVLLVIAIVFLEEWLRIGLVTVVTLVTVPFALAWSAALGQTVGFLKETGSQLVPGLSRMSSQFAIFLSAGYFVKAMHLSGADHTANIMFLSLHDAVGTQLFLILIPIMALIVSFLGLHPLVAIALLGESLKPEVLGINPTQLAITLIGSSVLTYMLGPFSGTLALVQSINQVSTFRLSLWNAPYAAGYFVLLVMTVLYVT